MTDRADRDLLALYVRLYFDEDISRDIVENLRQVTHNRHDFELRHQRYLSASRPHLGIIIAKRRASDATVVHKLLALLDTVTADEMRNQLRYI